MDSLVQVDLMSLGSRGGSVLPLGTAHHQNQSSVSGYFGCFHRRNPIFFLLQSGVIQCYWVDFEQKLTIFRNILWVTSCELSDLLYHVFLAFEMNESSCFVVMQCEFPKKPVSICNIKQFLDTVDCPAVASIMTPMREQCAC